ncbi:MAG: MAPEG family protein [Pseudomonadota bacterium]
MVSWILACLGVYILYVFAAGTILFARIGPTAYMGPRDNLPAQSVYYERAKKASVNFAETLPVFLGLAILALVVDSADLVLAQLGAMLYVLTRLVYLPVYVSGIPFIRSVVFTPALVGLGMMAWALL